MSCRTRPPWPGDEARRRWAQSPKAEREDKPCRLCARGKLPTNRYSWHPRCGDIAGAAMFLYPGLQWCLRRQRGLCPCGTRLADRVEIPVYRGAKEYGFRVAWQVKSAVELDHVTPLWQVDMMPEGRQTLRWWLPGNLQALCVPCHRAKTKAESAQRAEQRNPQQRLL